MTCVAIRLGCYQKLILKITVLLKANFISGKMSTISFQYEERSELPIMNYTSSFIAHDSLHIFAGTLERENFNGA